MTPARQSRRGLIIVAAGITIVTILAIAFSSGGGRPTGSTISAAALASAADKTRTGTLHMTGSMKGSGSAGSTTVNFAGDLDNVNDRMSLAMSLPGNSRTVETRFVGEHAYVSYRGETFPGGARWLVTDVGGTSDTSADTSITSSALDAMDKTNSEATSLGRENIDGADTTHYRFTVDFSGVIEAMKARQGEASPFAVAAEALAGLVDFEHVPAEGWIDDEGRMRRFRFDVPTGVAGEPPALSFDYAFSRFGEPVSIVEPDPTDTVTAAELEVLETNAATG